MTLSTHGKFFGVACAVFASACLLNGCGDDDGGGSDDVQFSSQLAASQALAGGTVQIVYQDSGSAPANTDLIADVDGDLATLGDQVVIALNRPAMTGVQQTVDWLTTGVTPGVYRIFARFDDGSSVSEIETDFPVTVNGVVASMPTNGEILPSTAFNLKLMFQFPLTGLTPSSSNLPVFTDGAPTPGTYWLVNGDTTVEFLPTSGVFDAGKMIRIDVMTDLAPTAAPPLVTSQVNFQTTVSKAYGIGRFDNTLNVMDVAMMTETMLVTLGADDDPFFCLGHPNGKVYVGLRGDNNTQVDGQVLVFDTASNMVGTPITLTKTGGVQHLTAAGLAFSPDATKLYVATYEGTDAYTSSSIPFLNVIDVATGLETGRVQLSATGSRLRSLAISRDGLRAFVPLYDQSGIVVVSLPGLTLVDVDGNSGNGNTLMVPPFGGPAGAAVSVDGSRLFVSCANGGPGLVSTNIAVFDAQTFAPMTSLSSVVASQASAPVIRVNDLDGRLYAGRIGYSSDHGLSVFDLAGPTETIVTTTSASFNNDNRDVAFVWGTDLAVIAAGDSGEAYVFMRSSPATPATILPTTMSGMSGVATIPPRRY